MSRRALGWVAWLSLAAAPAFGQPFESVYGGGRDSLESGRKVKPAVACPGGGYVAVGDTRPPGLPSRLYVVRVGANGATVWERTYAVTLTGSHIGYSIAEARDGSGFIVAGTVRFERSGLDAVLVKIACDGSPRWAWTYDSISSVAQDEYAYDVVEAQYGDPVSGTHPGDILVAGTAYGPEGWPDIGGFLMRTRSNGLLIWNRRYTSSPGEQLFALTEVRPSGGIGAGDVVATGLRYHDASTTSLGYAVRVSGNTGLIGASPQGAATYGGTDGEGLNSVIALRTAPHAGELVMAGVTFEGFEREGPGRDVWLVRTGPDPTALLAQRRIGEPGDGHDEIAAEVAEVLKATPLARAGDLVVAGSAFGRVVAVGPGGDASLFLADPGTLEPLADTGRLYGDHTGGLDQASSVVVHPGGFVLAGFSASNFEGLQPVDPGDLYLVSTDRWGHTSCDLPWNPPSRDPEFKGESVTPTATSFLRQATRNVWMWWSDTGYRHCP